jgi:hypothetical protein
LEVKPVNRLTGLALLSLICLAARPQDPKETPLPAPDAEGWITLFNGKDLAGWSGDPAVWRVKDGYISGKAKAVEGNTFLICPHAFGDFVLEAKCMLVPAGQFPNSGIQYRSKVVDPAAWVVHGYQADIGEGGWGVLYEEGGRGILVEPKEETGKSVKADWNQYVITAQGAKVKHEINGFVTADFEDKDEKARPSEGIIALQYHAPGEDFEIRFKDVRIKPLPKK